MTINDLINTARDYVFRYECQLVYNEPSEQPSLAAWASTGALIPPDGTSQWRTTVREVRARGAVFRRVRVIDEPMNTYLRWEMRLAEEVNIPAGEDIRTLRVDHEARGGLPDHDFWMSDGRVLVMVYGPDGFDHTEEVTDPACIARYDQWRHTAWDNSQEWQWRL